MYFSFILFVYEVQISSNPFLYFYIPSRNLGQVNTNIPYSYLDLLYPNSKTFFQKLSRMQQWNFGPPKLVGLLDHTISPLRHPDVQSTQSRQQWDPLYYTPSIICFFCSTLQITKKAMIFYGFMNKTSAFNILTFPNIVANIANT